MPDPNLVRRIDDMHALECASLVLRVTESASYVPPDDLDDAAALEQMADEHREHQRWLVELLDRLDATPGPRRVDTASADLHYNRIESLLPRFIENEKKLIQSYEKTAAQVADEPQAAELLTRIASRHREHLSRLEQLAGANASS